MRMTDTDMIAGYIMTWVLIGAAIGTAAWIIVGLIGLAWSIVYPLIVMMMAAIP